MGWRCVPFLLSLLVGLPLLAPGRAATKDFPGEIAGPDGAPMVLVPPGWFLMGSAEDEEGAGANEKPRRRLYLDAFYIDKHPVTNARYLRFARAAGAKGPEWMEPGSAYNVDTGRKGVYYGMLGSALKGPDHPVVGVSWHDASAYCRWAGGRLPTEAEWEKAARGADGRKYPWGAAWDPDKLIHGGNGRGKTHPVSRSYHTHQSPYGAVDMAGNVWEWASDWYAGDFYRPAPERNPKGPKSGRLRVVRGGSWYNTGARSFRAARRDRSPPERRFNHLGFRCARDAR